METDELQKVSGRSHRAALALADAAADRGLLDVAYGFADSPFGRLLVALTKRGVVRVAYPDHEVDQELQELSAAVSPRILESVAATANIRRELEEYFEGKRRGFSVPVDLTTTQGFTRRVLEQTTRIPFGSVVTYRDVAAPRACALLATRWAPTPSLSWCPATGWSGPAEAWAATRAGSVARSPFWPWRASSCRGHPGQPGAEARPGTRARCLGWTSRRPWDAWRAPR